MGDENEQSGFDITFKKLPPELVVRLWTLALDADTSKVNLAYKPGSFVTSLAYNYGGAVEAAFIYRRFRTTAAVDPSNGDVNFGLVFRGFKFGASTNLNQPKLGMNLGYGAGLLPYPDELSEIFTAGAGGLSNMGRDAGAALDNPLRYYDLHSDDAKAIGKAISAGQKIYKSAEAEDRFGVGLRVNYLPQTGLMIYGGAQYIF
jgi:hypothetical protein